MQDGEVLSAGTKEATGANGRARCAAADAAYPGSCSNIIDPFSLIQFNSINLIIQISSRFQATRTAFFFHLRFSSFFRSLTVFVLVARVCALDDDSSPPGWGSRDWGIQRNECIRAGLPGCLEKIIPLSPSFFPSPPLCCRRPFFLQPAHPYFPHPITGTYISADPPIFHRPSYVQGVYHCRAPTYRPADRYTPHRWTDQNKCVLSPSSLPF